ncbi:MAG: hypothetical protein KF773_29890 [Deltaproteobacteria bacterium]|nr:hypothetical protein [Deltaproteobacteria bacterium]MCW5808123.1 hypothetical protein [Deltaproteobacteria bacterium]
MIAADPNPNPTRSIRIAAAIAERYEAILRSGGHTAGSNDSELALRIGEAQQVYPEIWTHLDEARRALADRDPAALADFDRLRAVEHPAKLGVTDVEIVQHVDYRGRVVAETKTAAFNIQGFHRAVAAVRALERAMPEVDWVGLARAEHQELAAAGSLTGKRNRNLAIGAAAVVILLLLLRAL